MRKLKKAFTLVELVVVIAVIAILSGIAVASFSGVTAKAKWAADTALVDQWNTLLKVDEVEHEMQDVIEVKEYILDNGFSEKDFTPRSKDYGFYYCDENNRTYICYDADGLENLKVEYPQKDGVASRYNTYNLSKEYIRIETPSGSSVIESSEESSSSEEISSSEHIGGYNFIILDTITYSYETSGGNKQITLNLANEQGKIELYFVPNGSNYDYVVYQDSIMYGTAITLPHTWTDVVSVYRDDTYINYYKGNDFTTAYTKDFGDDTPLVLDSDISIIKAGMGNCIDDNSLITMADYTTKAMKDIKVGDYVLSIDFDTNTLVGRKVIYSGAEEDYYDTWTVPCYYKHTFSDGTIIKRAMRHRFYCLEEQCYKHMDTWSTGLHGYKQDGTNPYLVSTTIEQEEIHYGRITLEGSNNFFANGLSTGDSECCPNPVTLNSFLGE